jgi:hypothetical protein
MGRMPRLGLSRRLGPVGTALTVWDIWRRLPPTQRRWVTGQVRRHGPRIAREAFARQQRKRRR